MTAIGKAIGSANAVVVVDAREIVGYFCAMVDAIVRGYFEAIEEG